MLLKDRVSNLILFLQCSNNQRYKGLKTALDNKHLFNKDVYPKTYDQHLHQVANHKMPEDWKKNLYKKTSQQEGVAFVQQGAVKLDEKLI